MRKVLEQLISWYSLCGIILTESTIYMYVRLLLESSILILTACQALRMLERIGNRISSAENPVLPHL